MKNHSLGLKASKINTCRSSPDLKKKSKAQEKNPTSIPFDLFPYSPIPINQTLKKILPYFIKNQESNYFKNHAYRLKKPAFKIDEDYFKFLMDNAPDSIFIQTNWKFSYLNKNAVKLFGANSPRELIGTPVLERIKADFKKKAETRIRGLNEKKEIQDSQELVFLRLDGTHVSVETTGIPFNFKGLVGALVFVRDITERRNTQQILEKALAKSEGINLLKTQFLQNLSHEIRTPLNAIQGFSELMMMKGFSDEKKEEFLENIRKGTSELSSIVSKSVTLSLLESNLESVKLSYSFIELILDELTECFSGNPKLKEIQLFAEKTSPELNLLVDQGKIYTILYNLMENALKFTNNGKIEYGYRIEDGFILFFVKDTGIGIPDEFKETIFERFFQIEKPGNKSHHGLGLGLAISKSLTELMGGKIWVESIEGKGSEFYFSIPFS